MVGGPARAADPGRVPDARRLTWGRPGPRSRAPRGAGSDLRGRITRQRGVGDVVRLGRRFHLGDRLARTKPGQGGDVERVHGEDELVGAAAEARTAELRGQRTGAARLLVRATD